MRCVFRCVRSSAFLLFILSPMHSANAGAGVDCVDQFYQSLVDAGRACHADQEASRDPLAGLPTRVCFGGGETEVSCDGGSCGFLGFFESAPIGFRASNICFWFRDPSCLPGEVFSGPAPGHCGGAPQVIKLSNDAGLPTSDTLAEVEPGKATTNLRVRVFNANGQLVPNANVKLEVTVIAKSGGHQHDGPPPRPKGELSNGVVVDTMITGNTGPNGMGFAFAAPDPAGDHKITASCLDRTCKQEGPDTVRVGVKGLVPIPESPTYVLITPNTDTLHPNNHYLTPASITVLQKLAGRYSQQFTAGLLLNLNDASLERGGLFDIGARNGIPWRPPHVTHKKGTEIDIRANPQINPTTSIPEANFEAFEVNVRKVGATRCPAGAGPAYAGTDNQHYHVCLTGGACCV